MKRIWILFVFVFLFQNVAAAGTSQPLNREKEELDRAATKVYKTALDQMTAGEYWKAAQNLIVITDYYSDYKNMDAVLYQLGNCMFHMDLYSAAERIFVYLIKNYIDSPYVSNALYGLERVYYADKRYNKALTYFQVIQDRFPQMNEMDGALYYAGQSFFYTKDFTESLILLGKISPKSSFGGYALYTMGLDYLKKKSVDNAIRSFQKILDLPKIYSEWNALRQRARLVLGLIYFELKDYPHSVDYLKGVSENSAEYSKALLGLAWDFMKMKEYHKAVPPLEIFVKKFPHSEYMPEVYLLLGQAHLKLHLYEKSIYYFNKILELFPKDEKRELIIQSIVKNIDAEEKLIKQIQVNLLLMETRLLNSIRIVSNKKYIPKFMFQQKNQLEKRRKLLLKEIYRERIEYENLLSQIDQLRLVYEKRNRDWRSYAEYGISRALYLKEQE